MYRTIIKCHLWSQHHWETAIFASDDWKYIIPDSEPSVSWKTIDFDDSDWNLFPRRIWLR